MQGEVANRAADFALGNQDDLIHEPRLECEDLGRHVGDGDPVADRVRGDVHRVPGGARAVE